MSSLTRPLVIGSLLLPNRVVMAPLTRARAGAGRVPTELMADYYAQRAGAGLILAEATSVSPQGVGYQRTPGIWNEEQVTGWRRVTEAVHAAGGRIMLQLWHVGRISDPVLLDGALPVAPSAVRPAGHPARLRPMRPYAVPRALGVHEIAVIVEDFRRGAENAKRAGFDGVMVHGGNGYLVDQFLQDRTNHRTDAYGGSLQNRARFLLEVTDAAIEVWGTDRVGVHLRPRGPEENDMGDSDPSATFTYAARRLGERGVSFLFFREREADDSLLPGLRREFGGTIIANEDITGESAERLVADGTADAVAFGRAWIANPDLAQRLFLGAGLATPDPQTFYSGLHDDSAGYTDYPTCSMAGEDCGAAQRTA